MPLDHVELREVVSSLERLIPDSNFFHQGSKKMNLENSAQLKQIVERIQNQKSVKMANLVDPSAYSLDQAFLQPRTRTLDSSFDLLKLIDFLFRNMKQYLMSNLELPKADMVDIKNSFKRLYKIMRELEFIESLIHQHLSGANTWVLQKCPDSMIRYFYKVFDLF